MLKRFLEGCLLPPARAHVYWNGTFSDAEKRALAGPLPLRAWPDTEGTCAAGEDPAAWLLFDQSYYLPDDILAKVDRMSMAHSMEVRPPFLDHRIVEFAAALPEHLKIRRRAQKIVLKESDEGQAAAIDTLRRKKDGFDYSGARLAARSAARSAM